MDRIFEIISSVKEILLFIVVFLTSFFVYCQEDTCSIKIIQRDTIIFSLTPVNLTLATYDSADYYTWYCNGQIIDTCSPVITVTVQPGDTNIYVVKAGFLSDTNYVPNPYFEEGFTGFSVDTSLSVSDTLLYDSGHYNIGVSTSDFVTDICSKDGVNHVVSSASNGTNALMIAPHSNGKFHDTITIYKTKFRVPPQKDYVFYYSYMSLDHNCHQIGWAGAFEYKFINNESYNEDTYSPYYNNEEIDYWAWSCDYYPVINFLFAVHHSQKQRTERFFVQNDSIEIEFKSRQTYTEGFRNTFYILDSLEVREICYAYDTIRIGVINHLTPYDTVVDMSVCEEDFPIYFREHAINDAGIYTFSYKDSINFIDSLYSVNVIKYPSYLDTIKAYILKGQTYTENNFSENETGTYTLNYTTTEGCDSIVVLDLKVIDLRFPTVVTANGDGINDVFEIKDLLQQNYYTHTHLSIYNRSGKKVYDKMNIKTFDDFFSPQRENAPTGTYFYRFIATNGKDSLDFVGSFEVIR